MYNIVGLTGSLRKASTNKGLLRCAAEFCESEVLRDKVRFMILEAGELPFFNADVEDAGKPPSVRRFVSTVTAAHALVLATPEYNYSMAPALKNALDWASREKDNAALTGKPVALMGAGGLMGTSRAQYHLRQVCVRLDLYPLNKPEGFFNAFNGGFGHNGDVLDREIAQHVGKILLALVRELDSTGGVRR